MKKGELRELYQMMFPEYLDIVTVKELREMLGISRKLAYKLIDYGYIHAAVSYTHLDVYKRQLLAWWPDSISATFRNNPQYALRQEKVLKGLAPAPWSCHRKD